jgi:H+/Cl- antiporter ClcA
MQPLRAWPFSRVFWAALIWIIIAQIVFFRHAFAATAAILRTHPQTNVYSYLSSRAPPVPRAGLIVVAPPLVLVATWWWLRRRKPAAY